MTTLIRDWCPRAGLELSVEKSQLMNVNIHDLSPLKFRSNGSPLKFSNSIKYLRVEIDRELKFNVHLKYLEKKTDKLIEAINVMNHLKKDLQLAFRRVIDDS